MKKQTQQEYDNFDLTMRSLLRVPHSEIKEKLEAEKQAKKAKRKEKGK